MQIGTVNLIGHDQTVIDYENQSTEGDVLPADLRRVNFALRSLRDTVVQWNRARVLLARQNEAERHSAQGSEDAKVPLDRRDVLNEIALAIFAEYQGHTTPEQRKASKLLSLIEGTGEQRLKLATSTISSIDGLAVQWPAKAIAQHIISFFDSLSPTEQTSSLQKFTSGNEIVDYIKGFHSRFLDRPGSMLEGILHSFCTDQGEVQLSSTDIRQACLLLAIVPPQDTDLSVSIVSALGGFQLPAEVVANAVRTTMKDNSVELFPLEQDKVKVKVELSSASTANRKGKSSIARSHPFPEPTQKGSATPTPSSSSITCKESPFPEVVSGELSVSGSSASSRKGLAYSSKVLGIGKGTSKSFKWWNIISTKQIDSPQGLSLVETPNPGDLISYWNPKTATARVWMRVKAGSWKDISSPFLKNDGSIIHPSFPQHGENRRILTYARAGARVPTYVLPKTYSQKLKVGFDVPGVDVNEEEEEEEEEDEQSA